MLTIHPAALRIFMIEDECVLWEKKSLSSAIRAFIIKTFLQDSQENMLIMRCPVTKRKRMLITLGA